MKCYVSKVIEIAQGEIGYLEKASNKDLDSKTGNAGKNNYTKYARDLDAISSFYNGKKQGFDWCDVFVDWLFVKAFGVDDAKRLLCQPAKSLGAGCKYSMQYYEKAGKLKTSPQAGDQIFFKNGSSITHTGLVYKVDKTYVYTIEGNTSSGSGVIANGGAVQSKKYKLANSSIAGYGRPAYDVEPVKETATKKSVEEIAKEVIAGKWGNGTERKAALEKAGYNYSEVQKKVNELCKAPTKPEYQLVYTVKKGDSLWALATRYLGAGTRYGEIMKLNSKNSPTIFVGEKIKIPNR